MGQKHAADLRKEDMCFFSQSTHIIRIKCIQKKVAGGDLNENSNKNNPERESSSFFVFVLLSMSLKASTRFSPNASIFSLTHLHRIHASKVLVVGAGGIGCELLKNLCLAQFRHIHLVDLDTIETSNLNRQFLFRTKHVGKSKAIIAAESVAPWSPNTVITPHHQSIFTFKPSFFRQFDLILNALDNVPARLFVNRMAMLFHIPLVESGTAGYQGQTTRHVKQVTECFACSDHEKEQSFAVCTIRSWPSKAIHCVHWATSFLFTYFSLSSCHCLLIVS